MSHFGGRGWWFGLTTGLSHIIDITLVFDDTHFFRCSGWDGFHRPVEVRKQIMLMHSVSLLPLPSSCLDGWLWTWIGVCPSLVGRLLILGSILFVKSEFVLLCPVGLICSVLANEWLILSSFRWYFVPCWGLSTGVMGSLPVVCCEPRHVSEQIPYCKHSQYDGWCTHHLEEISKNDCRWFPIYTTCWRLVEKGGDGELIVGWKEDEGGHCWTTSGREEKASQKGGKRSRAFIHSSKNGKCGHAKWAVEHFFEFPGPKVRCM